jgi:hypothetical protein
LVVVVVVVVTPDVVAPGDVTFPFVPTGRVIAAAWCMPARLLVSEAIVGGADVMATGVSW